MFGKNGLSENAHRLVEEDYKLILEIIELHQDMVEEIVLDRRTSRKAVIFKIVQVRVIIVLKRPIILKKLILNRVIVYLNDCAIILYRFKDYNDIANNYNGPSW